MSNKTDSKNPRRSGEGGEKMNLFKQKEWFDSVVVKAAPICDELKKEVGPYKKLIISEDSVELITSERFEKMEGRPTK